MNKVIGHIVCGIDYEDHVNDRAYLDPADAETRMQYLMDLCNKVPRWDRDIGDTLDALDNDEIDAMDELDKLDSAVTQFCVEHDYPRNMENITKFRIEEIEIYGIG